MEDKRLEKLENYSCVIIKDGMEICSKERGVRPILDAIDVLDGALLIDRVIGKAAAFLAVYGNVKEIATRVISAPAVEVLKNAGIPFFAEQSVARIANRAGNGFCPMELMVMDVQSPAEAYSLLSSAVYKK